MAAIADWHDLTDEKEKYQAYLCSPEWGRLRAAVHKRADGVCERCHIWPIDAVHHLTYARKYQEELADLAGECKWCHEFTHGKGKWDFSGRFYWLGLYFQLCIKQNFPAWYPDIGCGGEYQLFIALLMASIDSLNGVSAILRDAGEDEAVHAIELAQDALGYSLPFIYAPISRCNFKNDYTIPEWHELGDLLGVKWPDVTEVFRGGGE
jgi:hypothetical protein